MRRNWIAVASAEHVLRGRAGAYMQVCHGKAAPLRRLAPGDRVVYYSPTFAFGSKTKLQEFTAIGTVKNRDPYQVQMQCDNGSVFLPYRRDVDWSAARAVKIQGLLSELEFSSGKINWGYQFRFGIFEISEHDLLCIASAMTAKLSASADVADCASPQLSLALEEAPT
jgi:hypothetical protein